eukprot:TRINITY_DN395_c0_g1_i1.p1 TRINITY_DN395_c0_g1~~TRINITY_DN395_c0_g1_i1.p1  ORF type:complete len:334 (+),score=93.18 TRINITY_DN395_c0_g1_i1:518-1519(+)
MERTSCCASVVTQTCEPLRLSHGGLLAPRFEPASTAQCPTHYVPTPPLSAVAKAARPLVSRAKPPRGLTPAKPTPPAPVVKAPVAAAALLSQVAEKVTSKLCGPPPTAVGPSTPTTPSLSSIPKRHVVLLDWDDTILPTSHLETLGLAGEAATPREVPQTILRGLVRLEVRVLALLRRAVALGDVRIVTNAGTGWCEQSASRFLPGVSDFLRKHNIKVVSARSRYETQLASEPCEWKVHTFRDEVNDLTCEAVQGTSSAETPEPLHVIVVGDALSDVYAAHAALGDRPSTLIKVVKLLETPTVGMLTNQLRVLVDNLDTILGLRHNLDIAMRA